MRSTTVAADVSMTIAMLRVALAQVPREAQAVLARHVDVDQREVDRLRRGDRARRAGALGADARRSRG